MKAKNRIKVWGLLAAFCLGCTACGSSGDTSVTDATSVMEEGNKYLKVWVPTEELDITREMCDLFLEKSGYDELTIECIDMSEADTVESLIVDWSATADVFKYSTGDGRVLVDAGLLLPIALNYDSLKEKFNPVAFEAASFDNFLYGVPIEANTWLMYYNKEVFSDEEVKSIESMLKKDTELEHNFACQISSNWFIESFYYANGCTLFGADGNQAGQCDWNKEAGYQVGKYLMNLANNPAYYEDLNGYAYEYFVEGKLGAFCSYVGSAAGLKAAMGDKLGIVNLPDATIAGEEVPLRCFVDYTVFGVKGCTKYPKEAQELAIWLGSEECQMMRYEQFGVLPTVTDLYTTEAVKADPAALAYVSQLEQCVTVPKLQQMKDYWAVATAFGEGIVQGTITEENLQYYLDVLVENITIEFVED